MNNLSAKNLMPDVAVLVSGVPHEHREELYNGLKQHFANPDNVFMSDSAAANSSYEAIIVAYTELTDVEKQNFAADLDRLSKFF